MVRIRAMMVPLAVPMGKLLLKTVYDGDTQHGSI